MEPISEIIDTGDFDREYGLEELLPLDQAQALLGELPTDLSASILSFDGHPFCGESLAPDAAAATIARWGPLSSDPALFQAGPNRGVAVPLIHELEVLGFIVLESGSGRFCDSDLTSIGRFAARAVSTIMRLSCRQYMTAGLHGQVVADSYRDLQQKADQLARSEEKYRLLAGDLEVEVARQTRKIRDTQVRMLQQEKLAAIGQLAAGMAHEINNPVGFVISNLNTLRDNARDMIALIARYQRLADHLAEKGPGGADGERVALHLAAIEQLRDRLDIDFVIEDTDTLIAESMEGAKRVERIVQNLRDFTHPGIDAAETVNINHCLDATLALLRSQSPATIVFRRDYKPLAPVRCHLREMNQVFFNVLKNATQAVGDHGEIAIQTREEAGSVRICISDTGEGMPPEVVGRVFDPFFTTREVGSGAGLGLTQAHNSVKSHGGQILVKSRTGSGARFTIILPLDGGGRGATPLEGPA
jgi:signal transduction histidine kinase